MWVDYLGVGRAPLITVTCAGRFHAFRLAEQLERRGELARFLTTTPPRRDEAVSRYKYNPWPEIAMRGPRRFGFAFASGDQVKARMFDHWAATHLPDESDTVVVWSGMGRETIAESKRRGWTTIVDRGSTHCLSQDAVLRRAHRDLNLPYTSPAMSDQLAEYESCDAIVVPSEWAKRTFVDNGIPSAKVRVVPYGVDIRKFSPSLRMPDRLIVLAVGASVRKNTVGLVKAFLSAGVVRSELWIAGTVPNDLRSVWSVVPEPHGLVKVLGHVPHRDLPDLYRQASCFVCASLEEGMSLALLEAMASGLPCLATPQSGAPDLGLIPRIEGPNDLTEWIRSIAASAVLQRSMGEYARAQAERFTWDAYGDRWLEATEGVRTRVPVAS